MVIGNGHQRPPLGQSGFVASQGGGFGGWAGSGLQDCQVSDRAGRDDCRRAEGRVMDGVCTT